MVVDDKLVVVVDMAGRNFRVASLIECSLPNIETLNYLCNRL